MFVLWGLEALYICPQDVILWAHWHTLLELSQVIGIDLPTRFLLARPADFDSHSVNGLVIRSPNCAEDQSVIGGLGALG